jgi:glycoprotein 6-alpha-L-fucosyltransferase
MEDMGFFDPERSDPILGVHVRHGDKFMESKTPPFSKYMEAVRKNFHGITRVFIASDDNYVFFESEMHPDYADFEFLWVETPPFESEPWKRFRKLLCDVYILSECDHFLGTMTSNLGRLVWELMNSKRQGARMVSMDSDYWTTP